MQVDRIDHITCRISFDNSKVKVKLRRGPAHNTREHYRANNQLRACVMQYGIEEVIKSGTLAKWMETLVKKSIFAYVRGGSLENCEFLINLEFYPDFVGLFI